jgi:hypothetical protein
MRLVRAIGRMARGCRGGLVAQDLAGPADYQVLPARLRPCLPTPLLINACRQGHRRTGHKGLWLPSASEHAMCCCGCVLAVGVLARQRQRNPTKHQAPSSHAHSKTHREAQEAPDMSSPPVTTSAPPEIADMLCPQRRTPVCIWDNEVRGGRRGEGGEGAEEQAPEQQRDASRNACVQRWRAAFVTAQAPPVLKHASKIVEDLARVQDSSRPRINHANPGKEKERARARVRGSRLRPVTQAVFCLHAPAACTCLPSQHSHY